ncbi:hypothetical protein BH20ACI4_BH20ACI4_23870 [soil metagenome]
MLKNIAIIFVISIFTATACMNSQVDTNAANNSPAGQSTDGGSGSGESGGKSGQNDAKNENAKTFRGMINGIGFEMNLVRDGDKLSGSYFYTKIGKPLKLSGKIAKDGKFTLEETDDSGKKTGVWNGTWKEEENAAGIALEGSWKKPSDSDGDSLSFYATEQVVNFAGNVKFTDKTIKENQASKRSEIFATYPEISGVDSAEKFNSVIKNRVTELIGAYKKQLADYSEEDVKSLPAETGLEQQIGYDVVMANNDFVSLLFSDYAYMGGAHGMTTYSPVNYDLKNNRELQLADIFEPNSGYLKTISEYSIADLKKRVGEMSDDEWITKGAGAEKENFSNWNLTKKGLLITFEPYQVAAYAAGPQTVIIPYDKLKNSLKKDGIVSQIAK